jgi:hypothetical protein
MRSCLDFRFYRHFSGGFLCLALFLLFGQSGLAQEVQADQADLARTQTDAAGVGAYPGGIAGHAPASPNDSDLGEQAILKRSDRYQPFTASVSVPAYWTSNVALVNSGEQDDFLVAPAVSLAYQPKLSNTLYGLVGVREQLFYYDEFDSLNFGSFDAEAGLIYLLPQFHNLVLRGEFIYNRLTKKDSFDDFFSNYSIFVSAELPFRLGRAQQLSLGADANISIDAVPEPPRRHDYEVYMAYSLSLTRALSLDAVGRLVARQYQLTDRVDVSEIFAASATYRVNQYITASAISSFAANQSNHSTFDYKVANLGGLFALSVKF